MSEQNDAEPSVAAANAAVLGELPFANRQDFTDAERGFVGSLPDAVIASDQAHKVVLTVGPENKVVPKIVELGPLSEGLRVIRAGLTCSESTPLR